MTRRRRITAALATLTALLMLAHPLATAHAIRDGLEPSELRLLIVGFLGIVLSAWSVGTLLAGSPPRPAPYKR